MTKKHCTKSNLSLGRAAFRAIALAAQPHAAFLPPHPEKRTTSSIESSQQTSADSGRIFFDKIDETSYAMGAAGMAMSFNGSHLMDVLDHLE